MHSVQDGAVRRVQRSVVRDQNEFLEGHILRIIVAALVPGLWDALPPTLLKERKKGVRTTEQKHLVPKRVATREHGEVLHDDGVRE